MTRVHHCSLVQEGYAHLQLESTHACVITSNQPATTDLATTDYKTVLQTQQTLSPSPPPPPPASLHTHNTPPPADCNLLPAQQQNPLPMPS